MKSELKAGIFAITALLILAATVYVMGKERRIFSTQHEYKVVFTDVKGLSAGAPIRLGGLTIGRVGGITFSESLADTRVYVSLLIDENFVDRIRRDSAATIDTQGLLGDRFINLVPGTIPAPLTPGGELKAIERPDIAEVLTGVNRIVSNSAEITDKIRIAVQEVDKDIVSRFEGVAAAFTDLTSTIGSATKRAEKGPSLLHSIAFDAEGAKVLPQLLDSLKTVAVFFEKFNSKQSGEELASTLRSLKSTLSNIEQVSKAISQGQGTLGALLMDPRIYDSLLEFTENANRSVILRQVVRSTLRE